MFENLRIVQYCYTIILLISYLDLNGEKMKKFLKFAMVLTLLNWFGLTKAMEEINPSTSNEVESVNPEQIFPVEIWTKILNVILDDVSIADNSQNIYAAIQKYEDRLSRISLGCGLFKDIIERDRKQYKEEYLAHLKQHFLEHRNQGSDVEGLYGKNDEWNINGCTGNIDYILARYMLYNNIDNIFSGVLSCLQDDAKKEKNICLLLSFFGADINSRDPMVEKNRYTALEWAIQSHPNLVPLLLAKGAIVHDEILELPEVTDNEELLALLTEAKNKSNDKTTIRS